MSRNDDLLDLERRVDFEQSIMNPTGLPQREIATTSTGAAVDSASDPVLCPEIVPC